VRVHVFINVYMCVSVEERADGWQACMLVLFIRVLDVLSCCSGLCDRYLHTIKALTVLYAYRPAFELS